MSIKKVMIISAMPHTKIGGVETYNRKLIKIFNELGYEVSEFVIKPIKDILQQPDVDSKLETDITFAGGLSYFYPMKAKKIIEKYIDDFDIVINASKLFSKKIISHRGHILVQHTPFEDYVPKSTPQRIKWFFDRNILGLGVKGDVFNLSAYSVFYSRYTNVNNYDGSFNIPLSSKLLKHKNFNTDFIWAARLHDAQKGIKNLVKIDNILGNGEIKVVGSGEDEQIIKENFGDRYLGHMKQKRLLDELTFAKAFVLTSNYEGAAYTVTEALCTGTPVVMFDTFRHARFYNECDSVFLIEPNRNDLFSERLKEIYNWTDKQRINASKEASVFAKKHLTDRMFINKWKNILKEL